MKKKKEQILTINESFGYSNKYHILIVKSSLDFIQFSSRMTHICKRNFSFLGEYGLENIPGIHHFKMAYAKGIHENIDLVIVENKTIIKNHSSLTKSNKEKTLQFKTLSLFEDYFYLVNSNGYALFKEDYTDFDYLLLLELDKEKDSKSLINSLLSSKKINCQDISFLLEMKERRKQDRVVFFQKLFYLSKSMVNESILKKEEKLLGTHKRIPKENNLDNIPFFSPPVPLSNYYLKILKEDSSFE